MTLGPFGRERARSHADNQDGHSRWKIASFSDEPNKRIKKTKNPFSFWSATKYVLILSILLWWLPVFGQMIAGYIGGRKAGSPIKGLAAAILPVITIFSVITALDIFLPQQLSGGSASASLLTGFTAAVPFIGPYLDFTREYVTQFISTLTVSSPYGMNSYILTLAFAYVGGILGEQSRREIEAASGGAGSHTTVMVAPSGSADEDAIHYRHPAQVSAHRAYGWGFLPVIRGRRTTNVQHFDELVAADNDEVEMVEDAPRRKTKHRRVLRRSSYPAAIERASPKKIKGLVDHRSHHHGAHASINPNRARSFSKAEKRIDREWDPKRKQKELAKVYNSNRSHHRGENRGTWKTF